MSAVISSLQHVKTQVATTAVDAKDILIKKTQEVSSKVISQAPSPSDVVQSVKTHLPRGIKITDEVLDYVPFGSTASNVIGYGLKHYVFKNAHPQEGVIREYEEHIKSKSDHLFAVYSIPFVGNLVKVGKNIYDYVYPSPSSLNIELVSLPPARKEETTPQENLNYEYELSEDEDGQQFLNRIIL